MTIKLHLHGPASAPGETIIEGRPGESLMQAAIAANVKGIEADCGGLLTCATCHVFLDEGDGFPPVSADEDDMLDVAATDREDNSRLSCQLVLAAGQEVRVTIPEAQL